MNAARVLQGKLNQVAWTITIVIALLPAQSYGTDNMIPIDNLEILVNTLSGNDSCRVCWDATEYTASHQQQQQQSKGGQ